MTSTAAWAQRADIVIVGAGIAGCALAARLAPLGLDIVLIEANAPVAGLPSVATTIADVDLRVSALSPASIRVLTEAGAWTHLPACVPCAYARMQVWEEDGSGRIGFAAEDAGVPSLGSIVENRWTVAALLRALQAHANVRLLAPATLAALELPLAAGGPVRVTLADGSTIAAGLLVGADGALSRVRDLCGIGVHETDMEQRAIVATVRTAAPHQATAWQSFLHSGPLALLPLATLPDERACSIVWSADTVRAGELLALSDTAFADALARASEGCVGRIEAVSSRLAFTLRQRHAASYVAPAVALVADAAHVVHPLAGQGINLGLADVAVLVEELARAHARGIAIGDAGVLARYQRRRRGDNALMLRAMEAFHRGFGARHPLARLLRNAGMSAVDGAPLLKLPFMKHALGL